MKDFWSISTCEAIGSRYQQVPAPMRAPVKKAYAPPSKVMNRSIAFSLAAEGTVTSFLVQDISLRASLLVNGVTSVDKGSRTF